MDRISIEEITTRVDELRSERDDLRSYVTDAEETLTDAKDPTSGMAPEDIADAAEALSDAVNNLADWDGAEELAELEALLEEIGGCGGDHKWEGNWYPAELIADDDFAEYAEELAGDIYDIPDTWPHRCIDWGQAADELRHDYTPVTFRNTDYLYRS